MEDRTCSPVPSFSIDPPLMTSTPKASPPQEEEQQPQVPGHTPHTRATQQPVLRVLPPPEGLPPLMVDAEGFWFKDNFYVKELAFYQPLTGQSWVGTFTPPFDKKCLKSSHATVLSRGQGHGLPWEGGEYPYGMAFTMIAHYTKHHKMYAVGLFKCLWLAQFSASLICDMEEQLGYGPEKRGLPLGKSVKCLCAFHDVSTHSCALNACFQMGLYYMKLFTMSSISAV